MWGECFNDSKKESHSFHIPSTWGTSWMWPRRSRSLPRKQHSGSTGRKDRKILEYLHIFLYISPALLLTYMATVFLLLNLWTKLLFYINNYVNNNFKQSSRKYLTNIHLTDKIYQDPRKFSFCQKLKTWTFSDNRYRSIVSSIIIKNFSAWKVDQSTLNKNSLPSIDGFC